MDYTSKQYHDLADAERKLMTTKIYLEQALNQLEYRDRGIRDFKFYLHLFLLGVGLVVFYLIMFSVSRHW